MVLRVKLEIVPSGDEEKVREIGRLDIFNKEQLDLPDVYRYGAIQLDKERNTGGLFAQSVLHRRRQGAWMLVERVLNELVNRESII